MCTIRDEKEEDDDDDEDNDDDNSSPSLCAAQTLDWYVHLHLYF